MTFFGSDEDRIVQQLMPELQRVTTSFEWLMHVLAWSVAIHLMIHIWRQWKNNKRVSEVQARISAKQLGTSSAASKVEDLTRENQALKLAVRLQRKAIKKTSRVRQFCVWS
jgi:cell division protein FtsL